MVTWQDLEDKVRELLTKRGTSPEDIERSIELLPTEIGSNDPIEIAYLLVENTIQEEELKGMKK